MRIMTLNLGRERWRRCAKFVPHTFILGEAPIISNVSILYIIGYVKDLSA